MSPQSTEAAHRASKICHEEQLCGFCRCTFPLSCQQDTRSLRATTKPSELRGPLATEVAGETQWTQYSDAPTAEQLVSAIEADPATYTILEAAFAQDIACSRAARLRYGSVP